MDINEIQQFIEANKDKDEVKAFVGKLSTPTIDVVKGFLEANQDGKLYLQSLTDAKVTKGIETFKTNNLTTLIDAEIKKRFPEKDPRDIALEEIRAELAANKLEKTREILKNSALTHATEKKIPTSIIDLCIGENEEVTLANLKKIEDAMQPYIQAVVDERLKSGYIPPNNDKTNTTVNPYAKATFNLTEQMKLEISNPTLASQFAAAAGIK